jgi:hypothetical protein
MGWTDISSAGFDRPGAPQAVAQVWNNANPAGPAATPPASRSRRAGTYIPARTSDGVTLPAVTDADIIGVEAPIWTETLRTIETIEFQAFPRLPATAEIGWSPRYDPVAAPERTLSSFQARLAARGAAWQARQRADGLAGVGPAGHNAGMTAQARARRGWLLSGDFGRFWLGQTISNLGSSFTLFALPLLVFKLTGSPINLGVTTACEFVPYLLFGLVIGAWVDRVDRKRLMIATDLARAAVIATIPLLAAADTLSVGWVYGIAFASATLTIAFDAAEFAAIPSLVPSGDDLVSANGRVQAGYSAAQIGGPLLAGLLITVAPVQQVLWVDAASFLASAGSLLLISTACNAGRPEGEGRRAIRREVADGLGSVLATRYCATSRP